MEYSNIGFANGEIPEERKNDRELILVVEKTSGVAEEFMPDLRKFLHEGPMSLPKGVLVWYPNGINNSEDRKPRIGLIYDPKQTDDATVIAEFKKNGIETSVSYTGSARYDVSVRNEK